MKKIKFNNLQKGLLTKAFLENLFPKPNHSDILVEENNLTSFFYFSDEYYNELVNYINQKHVLNGFKNSNAFYEWINLKDQLSYYENVASPPIKHSQYLFNSDLKNETFIQEKNEIYLKEIELNKIHIAYKNSLKEIKELYNKTIELYVNYVFRSICKENNVITLFSDSINNKFNYIGVIKLNSTYYLVDKDNNFNNIIYDDELLEIISSIKE